MILIGSQGLKHWIKDIERVSHDWDFLMTEIELDVFNNKYVKYQVKQTNYSIIYDIEGVIVEIRNPKHLDPTDIELLYKRCDSSWVPVVNTPFGGAFVPSWQDLYDIKKSTAMYIHEPKHKHDLELMQKYWLSRREDTDFFKRRAEETRNRVEKSNQVKYEFFHKYHIPEYVVHDRLHDMYAELLDLNMATYKRITTAETDISEELFNKLTHEQKISLMVEEVLVLNLERWFIPQMIENGINYKLIDKFYNNNEAMPTYLILKHVCLTGLKGEKEYITNFSKNNFFEIEKSWINAKIVIKNKGGLPQWFFQELFDLRKRFLNGENVAIS